jgi:fructose-1,6-bisphosphatase/inositol monophosphatase family enzyme
MAADFRSETRLAIDAVRQALAIAQRGVAAADVTSKDGRDVVTSVDLEVEDSICRILADAAKFCIQDPALLREPGARRAR